MNWQAKIKTMKWMVIQVQVKIFRPPSLTIQLLNLVQRDSTMTPFLRSALLVVPFCPTGPRELTLNILVGRAEPAAKPIKPCSLPFSVSLRRRWAGIPKLRPGALGVRGTLALYSTSGSPRYRFDIDEFEWYKLMDGLRWGLVWVWWWVWWEDKECDHENVEWFMNWRWAKWMEMRSVEGTIGLD